jgi:hypothetical protein
MSFEYVQEKYEPQKEVPPQLATLLKNFMRTIASQVNVSMPGEVVRYDKDKQLVDVQPHFKGVDAAGSEYDAPIIYNVPVGFMRGGGAMICIPLKKGDHVWLIFSDGSLEQWLTSGVHHLPSDPRKHSLSDCIAYPGVYPFSKSVPIHNGEDVIIRNAGGGEKCEIRIKPSGKMQILNRNEDMISVLFRFMMATAAGDQGGQWDAMDRMKSFLVV